VTSSQVFEVWDYRSKLAEYAIGMPLKIYKVLAKENELAKIENSKDQEMIEVIEWAHIPERKSKPHRSIICIVSTLSGFLLACFIVLIKDAWNSPEQVQTSLEAHQES
jgi:hypothetical protein